MSNSDYIREDCEMQWKNGTLRPLWFRPSTRVLDLETLDGIRLGRFYPPEEVMEFEQFCEALKRYRITTAKLVMHSDRTMRLTREQCATLIKLLKPVSVRLDSTESTRFEALLVNDSLELTEVDVDIDSDVLPIMMGLVAKFRKVRLHLAEEDLTYNPAVFLFIVEMLWFLRVELTNSRLPNLRSFFFERIQYGEPPSDARLQEIFKDFNPVVKTNEYNMEFRKYAIKLDFPKGSSCELELGLTKMFVTFEQSDECLVEV